MSEKVNLSRRSLLKSGVAIGGSAAVGAVLLRSQPDPASAQTSSFTANDQNVSNSDGTLTTLTIDPTFTLEWSDVGGTVDYIEFRFGLDIETDGFQYSEVVSVDAENQGASGSQTFDSFNSGNPVSLLNPPGDVGGFSASAFQENTEGETTTTTVNLSIGGIFKNSTTLTATLSDDTSFDPDQALFSRVGTNALVSTSFDVIVEHTTSSATIPSGSANTNAN
jgi:hypothetical protein